MRVWTLLLNCQRNVEDPFHTAHFHWNDFDKCMINATSVYKIHTPILFYILPFHILKRYVSWKVSCFLPIVSTYVIFYSYFVYFFDCALSEMCLLNLNTSCGVIGNYIHHYSINRRKILSSSPKIDKVVYNMGFNVNLNTFATHTPSVP